jgi:hypothetical protein
MKRIVLLGLSLFMLPDAVEAQAMTPLSELIASGAEDTYPLVRCAGFYLSGLEWAGEARLGAETSEQIKVSVEHIAQLASEMREPSLGQGARASVLRDIRSISDDYLARYETNYTTSGQAWGLDSLWQSDREICDLLLGRS